MSRWTGVGLVAAVAAVAAGIVGCGPAPVIRSAQEIAAESAQAASLSASPNGPTLAAQPTPTPSAQPTPTPSAQPTPTVRITVPSHPRALFFGGSYTASYLASRTSAGFVVQTAGALGWRYETAGFRGEGYQTQMSLADSVAGLQVEPPQVIVVEGGLSDLHHYGTSDAERTAAAALLSDLSKRFPGVPVIVVGPTITSPGDASAAQTISAAISAAAAAAHDPFIAATGWFPIADENTLVRSVDHRYPTDAGYARYAQQLAAAIQAIGG